MLIVRVRLRVLIVGFIRSGYVSWAAAWEFISRLHGKRVEEKPEAEAKEAGQKDHIWDAYPIPEYPVHYPRKIGS